MFKYLALKSGDEIVVSKNKLFDPRTIEIYEYVIENHIPVTLRNGNWAQQFYRLDEMMTYINTQFTDRDFVENILNHKPATNG